MLIHVSQPFIVYCQLGVKSLTETQRQPNIQQRSLWGSNTTVGLVLSVAIFRSLVVSSLLTCLPHELTRLNQNRAFTGLELDLFSTETTGHFRVL
jgi:hypothetical protein